MQNILRKLPKNKINLKRITMRLSKSPILLILVFLALTVPAYAQARNNNSANRRALDKISVEKEELRLHSSEINLRLKQKENNNLELNKATGQFLKLVQENKLITENKTQAKEIAKAAERMAKYSKELRQELDLEDFKVTINPIELPATQTPDEHLLKIAKNINELIEQVNLSQIVKNSSNKVKMKIVARHLTALEVYANNVKEITKKQD